MKSQTKSQSIPTADDVDALKALCDFRESHHAYLKLIKAGNDPSLISELPLYVCEMVEMLESLAVTHPELLADVAKENVAWPVMAARHLPQGVDFAALADRIQLGANAVVSVSPHARYRWDTPLNQFLFSVIQHHCLSTPQEFFFLTPPVHQPRLTRRSLPWYLDDLVMPLLDELREKQGSWDGVPSVAMLVKGIGDAAAQRRVVRKHIQAALLELAGPADRDQDSEPKTHAPEVAA